MQTSSVKHAVRTRSYPGGGAGSWLQAIPSAPKFPRRKSRRELPAGFAIPSLSTRSARVASRYRVAVIYYSTLTIIRSDSSQFQWLVAHRVNAVIRFVLPLAAYCILAGTQHMSALTQV